jgi:hypothetical protein
MGFAEMSGVWMEDVAFGMWFESLKMSCRILDREFTQYCGVDTAIATVDGLAVASETCVAPSWLHFAELGLDKLSTVECGTTAEAFTRIGVHCSCREGRGGGSECDCQRSGTIPGVFSGAVHK